MLVNLLKYHVVKGTVVASALTDGQTITSIADTGSKTYKFTAATSTLSTGATGSTDAKITTTDLLGSNGVVHVSLSRAPHMPPNNSFRIDGFGIVLHVELVDGCFPLAWIVARLFLVAWITSDV